MRSGQREKATSAFRTFLHLIRVRSGNLDLESIGLQSGRVIQYDFLLDSSQFKCLWLDETLALQSDGAREAFVIVFFVGSMLVNDEQLVLVLIMGRWPDSQYESKIELANDAHPREVRLGDSQRELVLGLRAVQFVFDDSGILAWTVDLRG